MSRSRRTNTFRGLAIECFEVTPPDLESDSESEVELESEPEYEPEPEPEPLPEPESDLEEMENPDNNEFFQEVDTPHIVPLAVGNQEFAISMKRIEVSADNFIWSVNIVTEDDDSQPECTCAFNEHLGRACIAFPDHPM